MAATSGSRSGTGKKRTSSSRTKSGSGKGKGGSRKRKGSIRQEERAIANEILLIAVFALCVLLFLCNFGVIGPVGNAVSSVMFGIFGMVAYVVPVLVFVGLAFGMSNRGNFFASLKIAAGILLFLLIGVVLELIGGKADSLESYSVVALYTAGAETKMGGGVLSGSLAWLLVHFLGMVGAVLLVIVLAIICLVIVTEKSFVGGVKTGSRRVYESAREDAMARRERARQRRQELERRREEEARERKEEEARRDAEKILRMDRKVYGVMPDLTLTEGPQAAGAEEVSRPAGNARPAAVSSGNREKMRKGQRADQPSGPDNLIDFGKIRIHSAGLEEESAADAAPGKNEPGKDSRAKDAPDRPEKEAESLRGKRETSSDPLAKVYRNADVFHDMRLMEPLHITVEPVNGRETEAEESALRCPEKPEVFSGIRFAEGAPASDLPEEPEEPSVFGMPQAQEPEGKDDRTEEPAEDGPAEALSEDGTNAGEEDKEDSVRTVSDDAAHTDVPAASPPGKAAEGAAQKKPEEAGRIRNAAEGSGEASAPPRPKAPPRPYQFPPLSLLKRAENKNGQDMARELKNTAIKLQQTLATFGVKVTITDISQGPAVTRYELQPEQGVKVSKIVGLTDDIKLNLAATDIRIEAPIPGKAAVGIEVPNRENTVVSLRELLESKAFREFPSRLAFAVGKDIAGKVVVSDIAKMPHMLIAGATGSGKSVCINTLIMSILYKAKPDEVKLILIDPKVVELSVYNGIPHLLIPVVTDPKQASGALHWGVAEMESRYQKFADWNVRDLKGYNKKVEEQRKKGDPNAPACLPQIVIIVDELADLMMVAPGEVEESICRLAQLARAAGIHLIIATQRPSVDVITGLIKANMPSRAAFAVSSGVDSRTILDMNGAEKLLGKGDMLFYPQGYPKPARVQGAFVSDSEVSDVVDFLKNQAIGNVYDERILEKVKTLEGSAPASAGGGGSERDPYFEQAGRFIIDKDKASIGMLQRMFKIGFNRAARIMDQLADAGVVGEEEGTKPRKILMSEEQFEQYIEETL